MTINEREIIAKDRLTVMSAISLRKISILVLPLAKLKILRVAMAKVLVLIPPPVEAGEAPIHIRRKTIMVVGKSIAAVSMVLNPAVLGVVAPKSAVTNFPNPLCPTKVLLYSRAKNATNAIAEMVSVVVRLTLLSMFKTHGRYPILFLPNESLFFMRYVRYWKIFDRIGKPRPPKTNDNITVN